MLLKEIFNQLRVLVPAQTNRESQQQSNTEPQGKQIEATCNNTAVETSISDLKDQSKKKFELLQQYFKLVGQSSNPFIGKTLGYIEQEINQLDNTSLEFPSHQQQSIIDFLNQLITIPLEHEKKLDSLREMLSVNQQNGFSPEEIPPVKIFQIRPLKSEKPAEKQLAIPERFTLPPPKQIEPLKILHYNSAYDVVVAVPIDKEAHPDGIKATKQAEAKIDPSHPLIAAKLGCLTESDFLANYGVKWDRTKCIRDLYQNFLDSHGLTLEGVTVNVSSNKEDSTYKIRIEGLGEFNPEYVEKTGATTKKDATDTAGGFGEGAKILSLVLLRDHGVNKVTFSSRNWRMDYHIGKFASGKDGLFRELNLVEDREGNYLELDTNSPELIEAIFSGLNLCYYPQNNDFKNPTYENKIGGFKYLGRNAKGNAYLVRQRYEISFGSRSCWEDGLSQMSIWTNQKNKAYVPDRDRTAIEESRIKDLMIKPIIEGMSDEDLMKTIRMLDDFWERSLDYYKEFPNERNSFGMVGISKGYNEADPNTGGIAANMLLLLIEEAKSRNIQTTFAEKMLSIPSNSSKFPSHYLQQLEQRGYKFYAYEFRGIGMKTAEQVWAELSKYEALEPTEAEIRQINILKEAVKILRSKFIKSRFLMNEVDIKKQVYIFNREDKVVNKDAVAEFRDDHIWFDRGYLAHSSFENALATYLHELTHKYGGDETAEFSYKLTDWLDICLKGSQDKETADQFANLKTLWNELVSENVQVKEDLNFLNGMVQSMSKRIPNKSLIDLLALSQLF